MNIKLVKNKCVILQFKNQKNEYHRPEIFIRFCPQHALLQLPFLIFGELKSVNDHTTYSSP